MLGSKTEVRLIVGGINPLKTCLLNRKLWYVKGPVVEWYRIAVPHHMSGIISSDWASRLSLSSLDDEAHFWLNGYVNKQNCHIWSEANPQVYFEAPLHPEKLTVWCALWAGGIIGP
ncbi:hypothetical protein TNCV_44691 [Trichonephila clavipes]|nr:hypothetical protein TNCV_44691 [Trichonephila clavipes]